MMGDDAQLAGPVTVGGVHRELAQYDFGDTVEQGAFARDVPVEHRRVAVHCLAESSHGKRARPIAIDDLERRAQDQGPGDVTAVAADRHG